MNNFRKIIETSNKTTLGTLIEEDGSYTDPGKETVSYLLRQHFPDNQPLKPTRHTCKSVTKADIDRWDPDWITENKLSTILSGFKTKKSPGTDGLSLS